MDNRINAIKSEVAKAITGKDEVIEKVLTAMLAGGHVLLDDVPGVGKTTMALAFSKAMGLYFRRVQFTPDVVPSDITGFTMYDKNTGEFSYVKGAAVCNFLLADEINRTSSKTQSALLEVMQEGRITVDGKTYKLPDPFIVMATQNPIGAAGTQALPEAQLDRFMIRISMGYPDTPAQIKILKSRNNSDPINLVQSVVNADDIAQMKQMVNIMYVDDKIFSYITSLVEATRNNEFVKLGVSPRGALHIASMAKSEAFVRGQDFVTPENVKSVFADVCAHRMLLQPKAQLAEKTAYTIIDEITETIKAPK